MSGSMIPIFDVTARIRGRRQLLINEGCARTVLECLAWIRGRGWMDLFAFVALPSRLHFLCRPRGIEMAHLLRHFETQTTFRITTILRRSKRNFLLQSFHAEPREDSVWEPFRADVVESDRAAWMRLERLHSSPLDGEWRLAAVPEEYPLSSACFYADGTLPVIAVDDLRCAIGDPAQA
jgi:hypothetical protein